METLVEDGESVDSERASRFHATVLQEARRLQTLVDDLMSLSRVEAEKHDHPREPLDLVRLAQQAARDGAGPKRRDRVRFASSQEKLFVRGDRAQLEQLVCNLVDNALKYGADDTEVTVGVGRDERERVVLTVSDTGEG